MNLVFNIYMYHLKTQIVIYIIVIIETFLLIILFKNSKNKTNIKSLKNNFTNYKYLVGCGLLHNIFISSCVISINIKLIYYI